MKQVTSSRNAVMGNYPWFGYGYGRSYEYTSSLAIGGWPLVHVCVGLDPETMRLRIAKGVIAIGDVAVGALAIGGAAAGFLYAVGGMAFGPAVIDATKCDGARS